MEWLTAVDEQKVLAETKFLADQNKTLTASANPQLAASVAAIYRANPWMKPGEILALAKANAPAPMVGAVSDLSAGQVGARTDPDKPRKKGWVERNLYDKLKTTTRWTFASLNTVADLTQNVASQVFNPNDPEGFDIGFKATQLGTMLATAQDEVDPVTGQKISAGSGFFMGGSAAERQSERARRVRGEINGHAWTIGRGAADLVFTPGSKEYNFLSGFLDAATTVVTDPTLIAGKFLAPIKAARAVIPSLQTADEIAAAAKLANRGERVLAGLDQAEQIAWDGSKFRKFITQDRRGVRLVDELAGNMDEFDIMARVFKYKIDIPTAKALAGATDREQILAIIGQQANRLDNATVGLLPSDIRQIPGATKGEWVKDRLPGYNSWRNSRLLTDVPNHVLVAGSAEDRIKAVKSYANFLDTMKVGSSSPEGKAVLKQVMDAYGSDDPAALKLVDKVFEDVVRKTLKADRWFGKGMSDDLIDEMFARVQATVDETRVYNVDEAGDIVDGAFIQTSIDSGVIDTPADWDLATMKNPRMAGPGAVIELLDKVKVLPDARVMRRLSSNPWIRRTLANKSGDPRGAIALTETLQNEIWKPLALATGGYIFRNMFDAQIRMATIGKEGFFNNPWGYMKFVMHKKAPSNVYGRAWDDFVDNAVKNIDDDVDTFVESQTVAVSRHIEDPVATMKQGTRQSGFKIVDKVAERAQWEEGLALELRQIGQDTILNLVAKGLEPDEIITYLHTDPVGQKALRKFTAYLKGGVKIVDDDGKMVTMKFNTVNDQVIKDWIQRLSVPRVALKTGKNDDLRFAVAYRGVPVGARESIDPRDLIDTDFIDGPVQHGKGSLINLREGPIPRDGITERMPTLAVVTDTGDGTRWQVQRISEHDVFDTPRGQRELAGLVKQVSNEPGNKLPQHVKFAERVKPHSELKESERHALNAKNKFVNFFFDRVYGSASRKFERSPVYRQFYYQHITDNADLLSKQDAGLLDQLVRSQAEIHGMDVADFVGGKKNWRKLQKTLANIGPDTTKPNPALVKKEGVLFHGTGTPLTGSRFGSVEDGAKASEFAGHKGIYFSDDPDLAVEFSTRQRPGSSSPTVYSAGLSPDAKMLDLRKMTVLEQREILSTDPDVLKQTYDGLISPRGGSNEYFIFNEGVITNVKPNAPTIASAGGGTGTIKQLEEYAQIRALNLTKEALFNAADKNNLEDMMRIIVPFGSAWREILTTYAGYVVENPARIRKAQLIYNGATDFDPDNDGQGFFYKDPVTGEMSFNIPMSGTLAKLVTGIDAPMQASVKGLSMGAQIFPAIGPVAQMAASKIIPDTPQTDNIVAVLLPYGRKGSDALGLGWVKKAYSAWEQNPGKLESVYANTYMETVRALSAMGGYDLSNVDERSRLLEDAKGKARWLTGFRALSQFLGPTAGSPEFIVPTDEGDVMTSALTSAFYKLQTENYDTAVQRFLEIYGEDALLYVSSKTRSVTSGIDATDQFGDWERGIGGGLIDKYPDVGAYFAPVGDDFSFSVWQRQIRNGDRERLNATEMIELAQKRIGSAIYRDLRKQAGTSPTQAQSDWLMRQRAKLHEQYPGFPAKSVFTVGEFDRDLAQLKLAVADSKLEGNEVAEAVKEYLGYRDRAAREVAAQGNKSLDGDKFIALRQWLYNHGVALADAVPDFARIWDQLLSSEVD